MDWRSIREEYVEGKDSYRSLAERHGVSLTVLTRKAKAEGWAGLRRKRKMTGCIVRIEDARGETADEDTSLTDDSAGLRTNGESGSHARDEEEEEARRRRRARRLKRAIEAMDEAAVSAGIRRKALLILDRMFDEYAEISSTEQRYVEDGVTNVRKLRDMTAIFKELTGSAPKAEEEDMEDLSALGELLKE